MVADGDSEHPKFSPYNFPREKISLAHRPASPLLDAYCNAESYARRATAKNERVWGTPQSHGLTRLPAERVFQDRKLGLTYSRGGSMGE